MKFVKFAVLVLISMVFFACEFGLEQEKKDYTAPETEDTTPIIPPNINDIVNISMSAPAKSYNNPVQKVIFSNGKSDITLRGLTNHNVYLVKVNKGNSTVASQNTGAVLSMGVSKEELEESARNTARVTQEQLPFMENAPISGVFTGPDGETIIRYDYQVNNEEILEALKAERLNARSVSREATSETVSPEYTIGTSTRDFWTQDKTERIFTKVNTTLRAQGEHSNVWVANINYDASSTSQTEENKRDNKVTSAQAAALAEKFDIIYEKETPIFGFENGGGITNTSDPDYGGVDHDPRVQILVLDVFDDFSSTQTGGVLGFFWPGDGFRDGDKKNLYAYQRSNEAEIFYIDAHFTDLVPEAMYSTLAHEFQHMIHYNQKVLKLDAKTMSGTWFNEMLSMLAEDLIDPFIGIDVSNMGHPVSGRIPTFLLNYTLDPTKWDSNNVYPSYANAYALGAYLVRNFGGVDFVSNVMKNAFIDSASLDAALNDDTNPFKSDGTNPLKSPVNNFAAALSRYGEALLFNQTEGDSSRPNRALSFNNTVRKTLPAEGGDEYVFTGFDIFKIENGRSLNGSKLFGPIIWNVEKNYSLAPHSVMLLSSTGWQNKTGSLSITLQQPTDPNVEFYLITR
jgi:hypothetical protein